MNRNHKTVTQQHGFTIVQMVVTLAIIAVVSVFGVLGIRNARAEFRLQNSARLFASYVEKARTDSIRRHAEVGAESWVETFGPGTSSYAITMDYGSGTVETRTFELDPGVTFDTAAQRVTFDWRGRLTELCDITKACVFQVKSQYLNRNVPVDVSGSGDITVDEQHFPDQLIPPVEISEVTGDVDTDPVPSPTEGESPIPDPDASPNPSPSPSPTAETGNGNGSGGGGGDTGTGNGNGNPHASPTPTPAPTPVEDPDAGPSPSPIPQCVSSISPSSLSLSQSDVTKQSGSATFTMVNATGVRTLSAGLAGNGSSLNVGLSLQRIDGSGSSVITVSTKNGAGNRGVFIVQVVTSPSCGSTAQLTVSVSN